MAEQQLKHLWLHDENKTTTIAPKVVIDDIQMNDNDSSELFKEEYNEFKNEFNEHKNAAAATVERIDTEIDNLKQTATPSSNGLMSKEDKIKLNGLRNYELPMANTTDLGGVKIDDDTIKIDSNGVISATQKIQNLEDLENVSINNLSDNNFLIYDQTNNKWKNSDTLDLSLELEQLSNVRTVELSNQDVLMYDNNNHIWTNRKFAGGEAIGIEEINSFFNTDYNGNNTYGNKVLKEGGLHYLIDEMKDEVTEIIHAPATSTSLGSIMVGDTLDITTEGVLNYNLPTASQNTLGGVKIDNSTIKIANGVISSSSEIDDEAETSATDKTWSAAKITQAISAGAGGEGTITSVSAGVGLTTSDGNPITSSGTVKAKLKSETASALPSAAMGNTTNRQYAVGVDADGYLSVNIPWTDTQSGGGSGENNLSDDILLIETPILKGYYDEDTGHSGTGLDNISIVTSTNGTITINGTIEENATIIFDGFDSNNNFSFDNLFVQDNDLLIGNYENSGVVLSINNSNNSAAAYDYGVINSNNYITNSKNRIFNVVIELIGTTYDNVVITPRLKQCKIQNNNFDNQLKSSVYWRGTGNYSSSQWNRFITNIPFASETVGNISFVVSGNKITISGTSQVIGGYDETQNSMRGISLKSSLYSLTKGIYIFKMFDPENTSSMYDNSITDKHINMYIFNTDTNGNIINKIGISNGNSIQFKITNSTNVYFWLSLDNYYYSETIQLVLYKVPSDYPLNKLLELNQEDFVVHEDEIKISNKIIDGVVATNGVVNLFDISSRTITSNTIGGITYTINNDYSITLNGTATNKIDKYVLDYYFTTPSYDYYFVSDEERNNDYYVGLYYRYNNEDFVLGSGGNLNLLNYTYRLVLTVNEGITLDNVTIHPMIIHKSYWNIANNYYPPSLTNNQLINKINEITPINEIDNTSLHPVSSNVIWDCLGKLSFYLSRNVSSNFLKMYDYISLPSNTGLTINYYGDGFLINGTATTDVELEIGSTDISIYDFKRYVNKVRLTGCDSNGGNSRFYLIGYYVYNNENYESNDYGSGTDIYLYNTSSTQYIKVKLVIKSGATLDNINFSPKIMLTDDESLMNVLLSDTYIKSNQELEAEIKQLKTRIEILEQS